jgi:5-oxopent-3-ene-1,2,5-tricarboxylate decarboxylase / 2-hydroxyhepta-2,4-diene-1,7-dioate isomerase
VRLICYAGADGARLGLTEGSAEDLEKGQNILDFSQALQLYFAARRETVPFFRDGLELAEAGLLEADKIRQILTFIKEHALQSTLLLKDKPRLLAPIARPPKIVALGLNYAAHARESGREPPTEPIIFAKSPSAVIGPNEPVVYKAELGRIDPEVELGVVISRKAKGVSLERALDYVGGYTIVNDVTAREMQAKDIHDRLPWFRSKGIDTFCPLGPAIVLKDEITDPGNLELEMRVNGEVRQKANTSDLIFGIPSLVHHISRHITLEPGDIISTGTPGGIAPIKPGDIMEAWVEKIGVLRNPVVEG